jgi:DNA polymerase III epsilon subunit-like protein
VGDIRILYFDMEFANGQVPGSIYSIGYLVTDERFRTKKPCVDVLINPECRWNNYVERKILAYPKSEVEAAPAFPAHYKKLKKLFSRVDIAVGFAVSNDVSALNRDCARYGLEPIAYRWFDVERLCKKQEEHRDAHGLAGCYRAWCGGKPHDHSHRSDGDAYATMRVMEEICRASHVTADMLFEAYPDCAGDSVPASKRPPKKPSLFQRLFKKKQKKETSV